MVCHQWVGKREFYKLLSSFSIVITFVGAGVLPQKHFHI